MALRRNTYNSRARGNLIRPPGDGRRQECVFRLRFLILYPRAAEFLSLLIFPSRHSLLSSHLHKEQLRHKIAEANILFFAFREIPINLQNLFSAWPATDFRSQPVDLLRCMCVLGERERSLCGRSGGAQRARGGGGAVLWTFRVREGAGEWMWL